MGNIERKFSGWEVAQAIECCADPDLLSACIAADRDWKDAGSPSRFSFLSEWLNGDEAYTHNQYQTRLHEISLRRSQSDAHLRYSLIEHLLAERIVACGCRETPTAPSIAIPGPAWKYIYISSFRNCIAEKTRAKTQIFNLRIFPIIESLDVIDRLNGKTFVEAFQICLVDDPQLCAARKRAIASSGMPAPFGNEWLPYRAVWPVVLGDDPDIELAIESAEKSDETITDNLVTAANRIQSARFARLISYLSGGSLVAIGVRAADQKSGPVPPSIWLRDGVYVNLENGDLMGVPSRAKDRLSYPLKPLFTGLVLRKPESVHPISEIPLADLRPVATRKVSKGEKNITSKTATENTCCNWLMVFMRKSPHERPEIQEFYLRKALVKWPESLSKRGFYRMWAKAVAEAPAPKWSAVGRPRKSVQAKSPHQ